MANIDAQEKARLSAGGGSPTTGQGARVQTPDSIVFLNVTANKSPQADGFAAAGLSR